MGTCNKKDSVRKTLNNNLVLNLHMATFDRWWAN